MATITIPLHWGDCHTYRDSCGYALFREGVGSAGDGSVAVRIKCPTAAMRQFPRLPQDSKAVVYHHMGDCVQMRVRPIIGEPAVALVDVAVGRAQPGSVAMWSAEANRPVGSPDEAKKIASGFVHMAQSLVESLVAQPG